MPGEYVAALAFSVFIGALLYGLGFDARRWLEERRWRQDEDRAVERLKVIAATVRDELDYFAELCAWFADQAEEIADLDEIEPERTIA